MNIRIERTSAIGALALALAVAVSACAPREAIVESEPNPGVVSAGTGALRADLDRLAAAQASYRADNRFYATRAADLGFTASSGVRVDIIQGDRSGWSATASSGDAECAMYEGDVRSPRGYLTEAGRAACRT